MSGFQIRFQFLHESAFCFVGKTDQFNSCLCPSLADDLMARRLHDRMYLVDGMFFEMRRRTCMFLKYRPNL